MKNLIPGVSELSNMMSFEEQWKQVKDRAFRTIGKKAKSLPGDRWKKKILLAEHSPIRSLTYEIVLKDIPNFVSVHLVRHKHGVEHFVQTQRDDRTGVDRNERSQTDPVNHFMDVNAQALINISRKRLCRQSHRDTRVAWKDALKQVDPFICNVCVPECIYRGFCPEMKPCGYSDTDVYKDRLSLYRSV